MPFHPLSSTEAEELTYKGKQTETNHPLKPLFASLILSSTSKKEGFNFMLALIKRLYTSYQGS